MLNLHFYSQILQTVKYMAALSAFIIALPFIKLLTLHYHNQGVQLAINIVNIYIAHNKNLNIVTNNPSS